MKTLWAAAALALYTTLPTDSNAACGSAFCSVNTDWASQGEWTEHGGKLDLRYEFIDQHQPRHGAEAVGVGEVPQHHDEVSTINRNWIAQFDYNFNANWGVSASVPYFVRDHEHIHNHMGGQETEQWHMDELGDTRVLGRYQFSLNSEAPSALGFSLGLKLPTGKDDVVNDDGEAAERMLQPGSGTTDILAGVFYNRLVPGIGAVFVQARMESALDSKDQYRPGNRYFVDVGVRYPLSGSISLQAQLNALVKSRDYGVNAEPDESGGKYLYFTPGVSFAVSRALQFYAFAQLPIYQYVNGVQLTSHWGALAGASLRF